jgi:hypothetical protein
VEKSLGWKPIPLFDRDHAEEVASMQVLIVFGASSLSNFKDWNSVVFIFFKF